MQHVFHPKLWSTLKSYNSEQFIKDLLAGFIVAVIALPLSIALAIASGVGPERGLYTAIIGGFLISCLGGSRVQIGGPTGAFMIIVYSIVARYGVEGMLLATFMAGLMIMLMGFCKLGAMIKYIPYPVTSGFTTGIAVTILISQLKDFFGLSIGQKMPVAFFAKIKVLIAHLSTINSEAFILGLVSLVILFTWKRISKKIPAALVVLVLSSAAVKLFALQVETIGSAFGNISGGFMAPRLPAFSLELVQTMFMPALAIALLGSVESLLSAVVADGMISAKHRSNTELIAQGLANITCSLFGGIPATGAIARTVANINNGGRTPVAGIFHAIFLLAIMLIFMPLAKMIPLAALASILIMVAINMGEWRELKGILKAPRSDAFVLFSVFILTIIFDLVLAIEVGMVLAAFLFMKRMADYTSVTVRSLDRGEERPGETNQILDAEFSKTGIYVYEINGPFFFGATYQFVDTLSRMNPDTKSIIMRMQHVSSIDATAVAALRRMIKLCKERDVRLIFTELAPEVEKVLTKMDIIALIGDNNIYKSYEEASQDKE